MDPAVAWFQEEQDGPAKRIWMTIWDTISEMDSSTQTAVNHLNNNNNNFEQHNHQTTTMTKGNKELIIIDAANPNERTYYNPSKRKGSTIDNKASTFNMNKFQARLVGKHGGCPWRPLNFRYGRGVIG